MSKKCCIPLFSRLSAKMPLPMAFKNTKQKHKITSTTIKHFFLFPFYTLLSLKFAQSEIRAVVGCAKLKPREF